MGPLETGLAGSTQGTRARGPHTTAAGLAHAGHSVLTGRPGWGRLGDTDGRPYVGTLVALAPERPHWDDLAARLGRIGVGADDAVAGATLLSRGGVLARVLARTAPALRACLDALWSETRRSLLGLDPLDLRKL